MTCTHMLHARQTLGSASSVFTMWTVRLTSFTPSLSSHPGARWQDLPSRRVSLVLPPLPPSRTKAISDSPKLPPWIPSAPRGTVSRAFTWFWYCLSCKGLIRTARFAAFSLASWRQNGRPPDPFESPFVFAMELLGSSAWGVDGGSRRKRDVLMLSFLRNSPPAVALWMVQQLGWTEIRCTPSRLSSVTTASSA